MAKHTVSETTRILKEFEFTLGYLASLTEQMAHVISVTQKTCTLARISSEDGTLEDL